MGPYQRQRPEQFDVGVNSVVSVSGRLPERGLDGGPHESAVTEVMASKPQTRRQLRVSAPKTIPMSKVVAVAAESRSPQQSEQRSQTFLPRSGCLPPCFLRNRFGFQGRGFKFAQVHPMQFVDFGFGGLAKESSSTSFPYVVRKFPLQRCIARL